MRRKRNETNAKLFIALYIKRWITTNVLGYFIDSLTHSLIPHLQHRSEQKIREKMEKCIFSTFFSRMRQSEHSLKIICTLEKKFSTDFVIQSIFSFVG